MMLYNVLTYRHHSKYVQCTLLSRLQCRICDPLARLIDIGCLNREQGAICCNPLHTLSRAPSAASGRELKRLQVYLFPSQPASWLGQRSLGWCVVDNTRARQHQHRRHATGLPNKFFRPEHQTDLFIFTPPSQRMQQIYMSQIDSFVFVSQRQQLKRCCVADIAVSSTNKKYLLFT